VGPSPSSPGMRAVLQGLSELGYVERQNILIGRRALEGRLDRVPDMIAEMSRLNVEVLLAAGREVAVAARRVTTTLPIVVVDATYTPLRSVGPAPPRRGHGPPRSPEHTDGHDRSAVDPMEMPPLALRHRA